MSLQAIDDFAQAILDIYMQEGLTSVRGLHNEYLLAERQLLMWHSEVTRRCAVANNGRFYYFKNIDDIIFCSDELLYFTAHLFLYRPFINNPLEDAYPANGRTIYPNFQNLPSKRYSMFADVASQTAYNYWDRIGDLIASFFPGLLKPDRVYFASIVNTVPAQFHSSENYQWLKHFVDNGYKDLNDERKEIVHYHTTDTTYKYDHLERGRLDERSKVEQMQQAREGIADFYKNHIAVTLTGLEKTLLFLEEVDASLYSHIV